MNYKKLLFPAFILIVIVQLYIPAKMVFGREDILKTGTEYKFRTAPMDPNDPFRGKYIELDYSASTFNIEEGEEWENDENIFILLTTDEKGFAKIKSVSRQKPEKTTEFTNGKVVRTITRKPKMLIIQYPFDRYYMEEYKAPDAEKAFRESQRNNKEEAYALVNIKNGESVLKDVLIGGISIKEIAQSQKGAD